MLPVTSVVPVLVKPSTTTRTSTSVSATTSSNGATSSGTPSRFILPGTMMSADDRFSSTTPSSIPSIPTVVQVESTKLFAEDLLAKTSRQLVIQIDLCETLQKNLVEKTTNLKKATLNLQTQQLAISQLNEQVDQLQILNVVSQQQALRQAQTQAEDFENRCKDLFEQHKAAEVRLQKLRKDFASLRDANEELRRTNEELERTNEELQRTNGELRQTNEDTSRSRNLSLFNELALSRIELEKAQKQRDHEQNERDKAVQELFVTKNERDKAVEELFEELFALKKREREQNLVRKDTNVKDTNVKDTNDNDNNDDDERDESTRTGPRNVSRLTKKRAKCFNPERETMKTAIGKKVVVEWPIAGGVLKEFEGTITAVRQSKHSEVGFEFLVSYPEDDYDYAKSIWEPFGLGVRKYRFLDQDFTLPMNKDSSNKNKKNE